MDDSRVVPDPSDFDNFVPPLTRDEEGLISFFDDHLPLDWTIYVRPHMNGEWPSIVVLHPKEGIVIYDVLHWRQGKFKAITEQVEIDGLTYEQRRFVPTVTIHGDVPTPKVINPMKQAQRYLENLIGLYVPRIGEAVDYKPRYVKESITVGLYCPNFTTTKARNKLRGLGSQCTVFGSNHLKPEALENLVVPVMGESPRFSIDSWADEIKFFLNPPFHTEEMGKPIDLTAKQEKYAQPRPDTHRRLKGVAGSGKTLVLAQRAARNAAKDDHVLVVYYNITLGHYIRHYIKQAPYSFDWTNIEIIHFHEFCRRYLMENGIEWPKGEGDDVLTKVVPKRVIQAKQRGRNQKSRSYDIILIDEGQDFDELWFKALNLFLDGTGEVLLVADDRQNIYDRVHSFGGMQFSGPWGSLESSYRMPSNLVREVNRFADAFVPTEDKDYSTDSVKAASMQTEFGFAQPKLFWNNMRHFGESKRTALEVVEALTSEEGVHPQDIVVLVPQHEQGRELAGAFEEQGYELNHVFGLDGADAQSRRRKGTFIMEDGRLKLSTIHSFKGWELVNVVLITPQSEREIPPKADLDLLLYTAITRAQNSLFVFNQHPKYRSYGETWDSWSGRFPDES